MTHARIATRIVIAIVISVAAWTSAFAQPATDKSRRLKSQSTAAQKPVQAVRPRQPSSCSEFGAGFVRAPGSDTCLRIGGGVDVGVGAGR
ncbi:MAG: hypothetical protein BGN84_10855 [Afipia sp. 62-7]|nr:porin [Afipia sp.]OJU14924.1 MAG: hypothetical protein BGN84_10855 [Afipia sp. 62-7]